jgi:simple sugar transport system ATP-binding protein
VGLALDFTIAENYLLGRQRDPEWGGGRLLQPHRIAARASEMIQNYRVRVGEQRAQQTARTLSGGNQQKVVIARAMDSTPRLLVACQPTRGLDVDASQFVYQTLKAARSEGMGILLFSLDLDEVFEVSDRIAVMFNGRIVAVLPRLEATEALVGAYMTGAQSAESEENFA